VNSFYIAAILAYNMLLTGFCFMRIESIDFNFSSETELALVPSPPFDRQVYQEFQKLLTQDGPLSTVRFREEASRLYICTPELSLKLRETIEDFLTNAEHAAARAKRAEAEKERLDTERKERAILTAARALGLRINRANSDSLKLP
jgi:hypothetical protein